IAGVLIGGFSQRSGAQTEAESLSASFRKAAERAGRSVVAVRPAAGFAAWPQPGTTPFEPPLPARPVPQPRLRNPELGREATGAGIVVDADRGYILTHDSVLQGASQATVTLADGRERTSTQIRRDPRSELAIVAIEANGLNLTSAQWGNSRAIKPGD